MHMPTLIPPFALKNKVKSNIPLNKKAKVSNKKNRKKE